MRLTLLPFIVLVFCVSFATLHSQDSLTLIKGRIIETNSGKCLEGVGIKWLGSRYASQSNKNGDFSFSLPKRDVYYILFSHVSFDAVTKILKRGNKDTLTINIHLTYKTNLLDTVPVLAVHKPETLVGKPNYSVFDFDFYEEKLILLTAKKNLNDAQIQLSDYSGKIVSSIQLPKQAGEAKHFYHDYQGYCELICSDSIFRLDVMGNTLLASTVRKKDFENYLKPVDDSTHENLYYKNFWDKYPSFNYYSKNIHDSVSKLLGVIRNEDLMKLYNLEYYYLPSRMQLEARQIADYYKISEKIVAALLSGFTNSVYYEPLYAPLFVLNDTICVFNHYNDYLFHYNLENKLLDSVPISYHHPKNWREWKKQLFVDESTNKVYAYFSKDGHHYLKQINYRNGKEEFTYKLKNHSAEKIKLKDGYVYYIYRPFDSTQEKFLYREWIE